MNWLVVGGIILFLLLVFIIFKWTSRPKDKYNLDGSTIRIVKRHFSFIKMLSVVTILVGIALLIWQIPKLHTVSLNNSSSLEANNSSDTNTTLDSIIPAIDLVLFFSVLFFVLLAIGTFL